MFTPTIITFVLLLTTFFIMGCSKPKEPDNAATRKAEQLQNSLQGANRIAADANKKIREQQKAIHDSR